jgi:phosphotransferase system  glucose/maltose/N-acetylglucosamine-specific IIC component
VPFLAILAILLTMMLEISKIIVKRRPKTSALVSTTIKILIQQFNIIFMIAIALEVLKQENCFPILSYSMPVHLFHSVLVLARPVLPSRECHTWLPLTTVLQ